MGSEPASLPPVAENRLVPRRDSAALHAGIVALLALGAYSSSFAVPFQLDDGQSIVENPAVRSLGAFLSAPRPAARWVAYLTFALNGSLGGLAPWGYHVVNLVIHVAAALVLYALVLAVCAAVAPEGSTLRRRAPLAALVAAVLFVVHPLQTQAVTYVVQRMASLAAFLYLGAVLAYVRAAADEARRRRRVTHAAGMALAVLAMFTKEHTVTLPATLAVVEACFLAGSLRTRAARLAPFAVIAGVAAFAQRALGSVVASADAFAHVVSPGGAVSEPATATAAPPWLAYASAQPGVILRYLRLLVLPLGQNVEHDPPIPGSPVSAAALVPAAILVAIVAVPAVLAWRARRRSAGARIALFAIGWFVVTLSVESSVVPLADVMAEHRMYLPSAGIFLGAGCAMAWGADRLRGRIRTLATCGAALAVLLLAGATFARNEVWLDPVSLWGDAARKSPERSRPWIFLGQAALARGDSQAAIGLLESATRLRPRYDTGFLSLGKAYSEAGRLADAERTVRYAITASTRAPTRGAHMLLGLVLLRQGRIRDACGEFVAEAEIDHENPSARANIVACRISDGDLSGAVAAGQRLVAEQPDNAEGVYNLALAYAATGERALAAEAYRRFLFLRNPGQEPQREAARRWLAEHGEVGPER